MENTNTNTKFVFSKADEQSRLRKNASLLRDELYAIDSQLESLKKEENIEIVEWAKTTAIVQPIDSSCSCHRCLEGRQECGYTIKFVAKLATETRPLPTEVTSWSSRLEWHMPDKEEGFTPEEEEQYWCYGETPEEAIESLVDKFY